MFRVRHYFFVCCNIILIAISTSLDTKSHPHWSLLNDEKCGISNTDRIIGGKNATMGAYPWIARIGYRNDDPTLGDDQEITFRCGGTLINKFYVITAAHCIVNLPGRFKVAAVRLGEHNVATNPDCENGYCAPKIQDLKPIQITVHKEYNKPVFKNDIALIRLNASVIFNDYVRPICLVSGALLTKNFTGEIAEAAGWGLFRIDYLVGSTILQTIKLPILPIDLCEKAFKHHRAKIDDRQMCVGGKIGQDSCTGDSGGPLMKVDVLDGPPKYFLIGIVSFGIKNCGETATPAVYTRISAYINWILENVLS